MRYDHDLYFLQDGELRDWSLNLERGDEEKVGGGGPELFSVLQGGVQITIMDCEQVFKCQIGHRTRSPYLIETFLTLQQLTKITIRNKTDFPRKMIVIADKTTRKFNVRLKQFQRYRFQIALNSITV